MILNFIVMNVSIEIELSIKLFFNILFFLHLISYFSRFSFKHMYARYLYIFGKKILKLCNLFHKLLI